MAMADLDPEGGKSRSIRPRRRWTRRAIGLAILLAIGLFLVAWAHRERIADSFISDTLAGLGVEANYEIEQITPQHQVFTNIVVGDPAHPDLTIERLEAWIEPRLGLPSIGRLKVVRPRLFGTVQDGTPSFGALDPVIFPEQPDQPFVLPDMVLELVDARGLIEGDYGPIGLKAEGTGNLRGGFDGLLAANAPSLVLDGCEVQGATLYGQIGIDAERPTFSGPLRAAKADCAEMDLASESLAFELSVRVDRTLDGAQGRAQLSAAKIVLQDLATADLTGRTEFAWRDRGLTAEYAFDAAEMDSDFLRIAALSAEGTLRSRGKPAAYELEGDIEGSGVAVGTSLDTRLADAARAAEQSFAGPMLTQIRRRLAEEGRGSTLSASFTVRSRPEEGTSLVVPTAWLRGTGGETLLSLSRFQLGDAEGAPRFFGNFATGGRGLPRLTGRMERQDDGDLALRLTMAEYRVGSGRLAIPEMALFQGPGGVTGIAGRIEASGALPGGSVTGLRLPVSGTYSGSDGLMLWRNCADISFGRLQLAELMLVRRGLTLCPPARSAILRSNSAGMRIAAGAPSLDLSGTLGGTPVRIRTGATGFAWPGNLTVRSLDVALGPPDNTSRFAVSGLSARIASDIEGTFDGARLALSATPFDIRDAQGRWAYRDGAFEVSEADFTLEDRERQWRFAPLIAHDAALTLADGRITSSASLHEPTSEREVAQVKLAHHLETDDGRADFVVDHLRFDDQLQPDTLTPLALGTIANARGVLRGVGEIVWDEGGVVRSGGRFSSDSFDFAAAFGPVSGASGTVVFTDLINLTTAPNQEVRLAAINPGIEVLDGRLGFEIRGGETIQITGGSWPFMGGTLYLQPATMNFGEAEERHYTLEIEGLDAARFVEHMELANLSATGRFDGTLPLIFNEQGGRIEGGMLLSRPPGGNVSYVGELTYEDLSAMANFAFDTLKSLDYRSMSIAMDGPLTGEIVTRVRFDGVRQGEGTRKNLITRQLARLPVRFNVNVRAPFYNLITNIRAMYDPAFIRDPRSLGLIDGDGNAIPPSGSVLPTDEANIQRRESGNSQ